MSIGPADIPLVQLALKQVKSKQEYQRVLSVWLKLCLQLNSSQIGLAIGWSSVSVRRIQSSFRKQGIQSLLEKRRGGRRREHISFAREQSIIEKFARKAKHGGVLNVQQIRKAYEVSVGGPVALSTVYRLITRHGLRRFLPRARQEAVKR